MEPSAAETDSPKVGNVPDLGATDPRHILDPRVEQLRAQLSQLIIDLQDLAREAEAKEQKHVLDQALGLVNSPYLFVVVGEVKAGKSSFINALLAREVCKVAPSPCTDEIQEITYGDATGTEILGPRWKRLRQPIPLLNWIAIVDTPGTNSIIKNHEVVTRKYIPHSDLVVFIFPAKNPYTASAWELLEFVSAEWRRKVIFVLQQADLEPNLPVQMEGVHNQAARHGVETPVVFATSALLEQQGKTAESGFEPLREYIRKKVTGGRHFAEKLAAEMATLEKVLGELKEILSTAKAKLDEDRALREKVRQRLGFGQERSRKEVEQVIERLLDGYDALTADFREQFREGMQVRKIMRRSMPGSPSNKEWLDDLKRTFEEKLNRKVENVATEESRRFMESIQALVLDLIHETDQAGTPSETAAAFSKLQHQRDHILASIRSELMALSKDLNPLVTNLIESSRSLGPMLAGGSIMAVLGGTIAVVTKVAILDVTGGILASLGLLTGAFVILFKRSDIVKRFERGLKDGRKQFERELRDNLSSSLRGIFDALDAKFSQLDEILAAQEALLVPKLEKLDSLETRLAKLESEIRLLADSSPA